VLPDRTLTPSPGAPRCPRAPSSRTTLVSTGCRAYCERRRTQVSPSFAGRNRLVPAAFTCPVS